MTNDVLTTSLQQVRQRRQWTFDKYIDGSITQEDYDANNVRYAEEVAELEAKQKQLDNIDQSYYVTVSYLLNFFEHAADIFNVAKVNEKRQILGLLFSNLEFDGENVHYTLKEPWRRLFLCGNCSMWLDLQDSNLRMTGPKPVALPLGEGPIWCIYFIIEY